MLSIYSAEKDCPLDSKEIKPVNPEGYQPWIFIGRTEAEAPIFWPPDGKSQLIGKDSNAGKDWGRRRRRWQRMRWLDGIIDSTDMCLSKFQEIVKDWEAFASTGSQRVGYDWAINNNKMTSEKFVFIIRSKFEQSSSIKNKHNVNKKIVSLSPILLYTSILHELYFLSKGIYIRNHKMPNIKCLGSISIIRFNSIQLFNRYSYTLFFLALRSKVRKTDEVLAFSWGSFTPC